MRPAKPKIRAVKIRHFLRAFPAESVRFRGMTIWILVLLLFGLLGALGFYQGAIRGLVALCGVILGVALAMPLSPLVAPVFPLAGMTHQLWLWVLPPVLVFVLFLIVSTIVAFVAHRQVELHYKYKTDDVQYLRWLRLNKQLGICVGVVTGAVYFLLLGLLIYIVGYPTVQVATGENIPVALKFLNKAREDMKDTGLEKTLAKLDRTPDAYYEASDIIGLVYHNPLLHSRLSAYPAFISTSHRAEFQDIATDKEYFEMLQRQESIMQIIDHPKTQAVIKNSEILEELKQVDLKDLRQFLDTGKTTKYDQEKIIGRWQLNVPSTLSEIKKSQPNLSATEWSNIKTLFSALLSGTTVSFAPDSKVFVKTKSSEEIQQFFQAQAAQAAQAVQRQAAPPSGGATPRRGTAATPRSLTSRINPGAQTQDEVTRRRYGLPPSGSTAAPTPATAPAPAAAAAANPMARLNLSGEGVWKNEGEKYTVTLQQDGKERSMQGRFRGDFLVLNQSGVGMGIVFNKE